MQEVSELTNEQLIYDMLWCERKVADIDEHGDMNIARERHMRQKYFERKIQCINELLDRLDARKHNRKNIRVS